MNQSSNLVNKYDERERDSSASFDENMHSMNNGASLQSYVDDIPFEFNPKYRTIIISDVDIPEYDASQIRDILSKPVDFTLENKVLSEILDDIKRQKKEIEANNLHQQLSPPSIPVNINCQSSDSSSVLSVNSFPLSSHRSTSPIGVQIPVIDDSIPLKSVPSPSTSHRISSVRDISWPSNNQPESCTSTIPTPIYPSQSSSNSVKQKNCDSIHTNDLADIFDGRLISNDPFNDAELKSLNNAVELNHLYLAMGTANTIRR